MPLEPNDLIREIEGASSIWLRDLFALRALRSPIGREELRRLKGNFKQHGIPDADDLYPTVLAIARGNRFGSVLVYDHLWTGLLGASLRVMTDRAPESPYVFE